MQQVSQSTQNEHDARPFPHALWEVGAAALDRAQRLIGLHGQSVRYVFDESDLARRFEADGAEVHGWSAINLLVGLSIGMAMSTDLATLSDVVNAPDPLTKTAQTMSHKYYITNYAAGPQPTRAPKDKEDLKPPRMRSQIIAAHVSLRLDPPVT